MPESPEVQALAEDLGVRLAGRSITGAELEEFRTLKTRARPLETLVGAIVQGVRRYGKHVDLQTDRGHLVISFGRAGWAILAEPDTTAETEAAPLARLRFDDGAMLTVTDAGSWLSLGLSVVDDPQQVASIAKLGPDPLHPDYTREQFDRAIGGRRKQLKALLQEQESIAGIGGAYSDEILHAARLSPVRHAADLTAEETDRLYASTTQLLRGAAASRRGIPLAEMKAAKVASMSVHGRTGESCGVCGGTVRDIPGTKGAGQYCPACQTGGVELS